MFTSFHNSSIVLFLQCEQEALDVNSVGFIDETSQIIYSGSDNGVIKVRNCFLIMNQFFFCSINNRNNFLSISLNIQIWDRRCLNENNPREVGVFSGHLDGITYIDSKNDARYIISNSKDQTIKLWDMRQFSPPPSATPSTSRRRTRYYNRWDYRWDTVPKECKLTNIRCQLALKILT